MKRGTEKIIVLCFPFLMLACAPDIERPAKRELHYYLKAEEPLQKEEPVEEAPPKKAVPESKPEIPQVKTSAPIVKTPSYQAAEKLLNGVELKMRDKGIRASDVKDISEELSYLKGAIENRQLKGLERRIEALGKLIDEIKIDEDFILSKKIVLEDVITNIQPRGDFLESIDAGMEESARLIKEQKYPEANKILNELFWMLGE